MIKNENCWLKDKCNHIDCDRFCMRLFKLNYLYEEALIPMPQRVDIALYTDEDGTDRNEFILLSSICDDVVNFVESGSSAYIHSRGCGNGKTSFSLRILNRYLNKIWSKSEMGCKALFINVPKLLIALKDNIDNKNEYVTHIRENIAKADIVVWDDIATKQSTVFEAEHLLSMVEVRIAECKANVFTSNLSEEELHVALGDRLASRIIGSTYNIELHGKDKRGIK